jgi:hypothetical protein
VAPRRAVRWTAQPDATWRASSCSWSAPRHRRRTTRGDSRGPQGDLARAPAGPGAGLPYLALWNRVADLDPADVDAAFADATLVRATLMRITLHTVHADDHAVAHHAMQPTLRAARLGDPRFTGSGLTAEDADAIVPASSTTSPSRGRTRRSRRGSTRGSAGTPLWWALRHYAPVRHAVTGGAWSFEHRPRYVAADIAPPTPGDREAADEALGGARPPLPRGVRAGHGRGRGAVRAGAAGPREGGARAAGRARSSASTGPDGVELLDVPGAPRPPGEVPAPARLLGMWDSVLLAYHDRSRVIPPEHRTLVTRRNGDVLPTLLVDGQVAGVWRPVEGAIEAAAFHPLPDEAWEALADEARALLAVLADRDPRPYARHDHWWAKLPELEVRTLR